MRGYSLLHRRHCLDITQYPVHWSTCLRGWCMLERRLWLYFSWFLFAWFTCYWRYCMLLWHFVRHAFLLVTRCLLADLCAHKLDYHIIICWLVFLDCRWVIELPHLFDHNIRVFTLSFIHWLPSKGRCSTSLWFDRCNLWRLLGDSFARCCSIGWLQSVFNLFDETLMSVWGHRPSRYTLPQWMIGLTPVWLWWQVSLNLPWAFPFSVRYWTKRLVSLLQKSFSLLMSIITMLVRREMGLGKLSRLRQDLLVASVWSYCNAFWRLFISRVHPWLAHAGFALWRRPTVFMLLIWAF